MNDVESTCDRIIVLEGGKVTEQGTVAGFTADTEVIVLDVDDKREEVATALAARGINATLEGPSMTVAIQSEEQYDDIRDSVAETGARLRRMSPHRRQLAEIFRAVPMTGPTNRQTGAEVFDLGYRHYEGLREGRARARRAVYVNGLRTTLGIGRGTIPKVLAILMFGAAMVPAVIMAVVVSPCSSLRPRPCPRMPTTMNWSRWCCSCSPP